MIDAEVLSPSFLITKKTKGFVNILYTFLSLQLYNVTVEQVYEQQSSFDLYRVI